ncbi:MAG: hypothetical protein M4579_000067 [Chaenotheca gracillima]|nr:MAG: hypothetical protein M4579_000067 [Chaenotheca gracillima]
MSSHLPPHQPPTSPRPSPHPIPFSPLATARSEPPPVGLNEEHRARLEPGLDGDSQMTDVEGSADEGGDETRDSPVVSSLPVEVDRMDVVVIDGDHARQSRPRLDRDDAVLSDSVQDQVMNGAVLASGLHAPNDVSTGRRARRSPETSQTQPPSRRRRASARGESTDTADRPLPNNDDDESDATSDSDSVDTPTQDPMDVPMDFAPPRRSSTGSTSDSGAEAGNAPPVRVRIDPEDTSIPDQDELKDIESRSETYGNNHEHYEKKFFKDLDDPEYIPGDSGRIEWTVTNVRGTMENPNTEAFLRSPPVRIGGLDWNIKYYPKGNGTDHLSVYVQCSRPSSETVSKSSHPPSRRVSRASTPDQPPSVSALPQETANARNETEPVIGTFETSAEDVQSEDRGDAPRRASRDEDAMSDADSSSSESENEDDDEANAPRLDVAAQFGVVMYNPAEPRVHVSHGDYHRFCDSSPDWGWTRFHGPHDHIHKRFKGQRQALLRNDTLTFTAYLRVVQDETGTLWHHRSPKNSWNGFARTGFRALTTGNMDRSYLATALMSWCLLPPFQQIINSVPTEDPGNSFTDRPKRLVIALQKFMHNYRTQRPTSSAVSLRPVIDCFQRLGLLPGLQYDVVRCWEVLRSQLDSELEGTSYQRDLEDLFDGTITRPEEPQDIEVMTDAAQYPFSIGRAPSFRVPVRETGTVQNALSKALAGAGDQDTASIKRLPKLLQVELDRQEFDKKLRTWRKVEESVQIDENIDLGVWANDKEVDARYVLFSLVVHTGDLSSSLFSLVSRPGGPGTKWIAFQGNMERKETFCLTRKQAILAHEGSKSKKSLEESSAVAYVLLYVRNDVVDDMLQRGQSETQAPQWIGHSGADTRKEISDANEPKDNLTGEPIKLRIYCSDLFESHQGPGLLDIFNLPEDAFATGKMQDMTLQPDDTVLELQSRIASTRSDIEKPEQCQLWELEDIYEVLQKAFKKPLKHGALCDQWLSTATNKKVLMNVLTPEEARQASRIQLPPPPPPPPILIARMVPLRDIPPDSPGAPESTAPPEPPQIQDSNVGNSAETLTASDRNISVSVHGVDRILTPVSTTNAPRDEPPSTASQDAEHRPAETPEHQTADVDSQMSSPDEPGSALSAMEPEEDVHMTEAGSEPLQISSDEHNRLEDELRSNDGAPANAEEVRVSQNNDEVPSPPRVPTPPIDSVIIPRPPETIYFFVKRFDANKQTLTGVGSFISDQEEPIERTVRQKLHLPDEHRFILWEEGAALGVVRSLSGRSSFRRECVGNMSVVIVEDIISSADTNEILLNGGFESVHDYLKCSGARNDASRPLDGFVTLSYFSSAYFSGFMKNGRAHGHAKRIGMSGEDYEGAHVSGHRHGKGTMIFRNGDIYDGDWSQDLMEGEGNLSYAKTGNSYIGGFKAGRRHGKGTMHYLVSDEEQNLCQICYEDEMDCLFYDCGHVCACVGCAKQVDTCPVCRKPVISVVKMYRS